MDIFSQEAVEEVEMQETEVDADDAGNPSCGLSPPSHLEIVPCVKADYLAGQTEHLPKMRAVLIGD